MPDFAVFDVSKWPVVHVKLTGVPEDLEEFEDYLSGFDLLYGKKRRFNMIIDSTDIGDVSMYYIARQSFHMHSNEDKTKEYVDKVALVVTADFTTTLLNALFSMRKPVCETELFKSVEEAKEWVCKKSM
jgi:hypothetical protein